MTSSNNRTNVGRIDAIRPVRRYRHWTLEEKRALLEEAGQPGSSVSAVARKYGVNQNQIFTWRKVMRQGSLSAIRTEDPLTYVLEVKRLKAQILELESELERILSRKAVELEKLSDGLRGTGGKNIFCGSSCPGSTGGCEGDPANLERPSVARVPEGAERTNVPTAGASEGQ